MDVRALGSFSGFIIPSQPPPEPLPPCPWPRTPFWLIPGLSVPAPATPSQHWSLALSLALPPRWASDLHHSFVSCPLCFHFRLDLWMDPGPRAPLTIPGAVSAPFCHHLCSAHHAQSMLDKHPFSRDIAHAGVTLISRFIPTHGAAPLLWLPYNQQEGQ